MAERYGMKRVDLVQQLKDSLQDAQSAFTNGDDEDFKRHLDLAALDLGRVRPRRLRGSLTLVADQASYPAPALLLRFAATEWGASCRMQPWDDGWPGQLPRATVVEAAGARELRLEPAPTAAQIQQLGPAWPFFYYAGHVIGEDETETTVVPGDRGLLLLRAQAEAMKELAMRGAKKPVQLRDGLNSAPRNATPAALHETLMQAFETQARW